MFTSEAESPVKPAPGLALMAIGVPVLVALSVVLHDLRITFALSAVSLLVLVYLTRLRGQHLVIQAALFVCALAFASMAIFFGPHLLR